MGNIKIPREAVEASVRAMVGVVKVGTMELDFDTFSDSFQHSAREKALLGVEAAAPILIAAELRCLAQRYLQEADAASGADVISGLVAETYLNEAKKLQARALAVLAVSTQEETKGETDGQA